MAPNDHQTSFALLREKAGMTIEDVMELTEFDEGPLPADWIGELNNRGIEVVRDLHREAARAVLQAYGTLGGERY